MSIDTAAGVTAKLLYGEHGAVCPECNKPHRSLELYPLPRNFCTGCWTDLHAEYYRTRDGITAPSGMADWYIWYQERAAHGQASS